MECTSVVNVWKWFCWVGMPPHVLTLHGNMWVLWLHASPMFWYCGYKLWSSRSSYSTCSQLYNYTTQPNEEAHKHYDRHVQGFAKSLLHCIRPQSSVTSLYGSFSAVQWYNGTHNLLESDKILPVYLPAEPAPLSMLKGINENKK